MTDPIKAPTLETGATDAPELGADKPSSWDSIIDTVVDEATGETSFVVADAEPKPENGPSATVEDKPPGGVGDPPAPDKSYAEVRAWATRASQKNAELEKKVADLAKRHIDADEALDKDGFVERFANALPEDMGAVVGDRRAFARVVATAADHVVKRQTKSLQERADALEQGVGGMAAALEFLTEMVPEVGELLPYVQHIKTQYAAQNEGADVFGAFSRKDVLAVARSLRAANGGGTAQPTQPTTTTVTGQAKTPPTAEPTQREARPANRAAAAAADPGVAMHDRDLKDLGREPAKGPKAFGLNVRSIIDDVLGDAASGELG